MTFRLEIATNGALFTSDRHQEPGEAAKLATASVLRSLAVDLVADADAAALTGPLHDEADNPVGTWTLELEGGAHTPSDEVATAERVAAIFRERVTVQDTGAGFTFNGLEDAAAEIARLLQGART